MVMSPKTAGSNDRRGAVANARGFRARTSVVGLAMMCLALVPSVARGQDGAIKASDGWVQLPAEGATSTLAFASVRNPGMYAIYLISATSDVAGKVELRDARKGTQPVEVTVGQDATTYMDPKAIHMYLSNLKRPLKEGETINIVLTTEADIKIEVAAVVKKP
jgi:copper(I)-binding protein